MKKIILHVGTHKTGSTSIQETFYQNRGLLLKFNIHYLSIGSNHWDLYSAFMDKPWKWFQNTSLGYTKDKVIQKNKQTLKKVKAEIIASNCETIIISAEHLSMLTQNNLQEMKKYFEELGHVKIVYYTREILSWMASDSQQCAKVGMKTTPTDYDTAIQRLFDFPLNFISVFGRDNFTLLCFEKAVSVGLCNSLLEPYNLPSIEEMKIAELRENKSVTSTAVKSFYLFNSLKSGNTLGRNKLLVNFIRKLPGSKYAINNLTEEQCIDYNTKIKFISDALGLSVPLYSSIKYDKSKCLDGITFTDEEVLIFTNKMLGLINHLITQDCKSLSILKKINRILEKPEQTKGNESVLVLLKLIHSYLNDTPPVYIRWYSKLKSVVTNK